MNNPKKLIKSLASFLVIVILFFVSVNFVSAESLWDSQSGMKTDPGQIGSAFGGGETKDLRTLVVYIIKVLLSFLALFFTVLIIIAGFHWMNSRGNEDEVTKAKSQIKNAIIGIIIIIAAYAITVFVISMTEMAINGDV